MGGAWEIHTSSEGLSPAVEDTSGEQGGRGAGALVQERRTPGILAGWERQPEAQEETFDLLWRFIFFP